MSDGPVPVLAAELIRWSWIGDNLDDIRDSLIQHVQLTVLAVLFGLLLAFPLALMAIRWPRTYGPVLGFTGVLFTIPSLALFVLLIPFTGLSVRTSLIGLTIYTLLILVRNIVEGLRGVDRDVREAAQAMGYTRARQLLQVELPMALPVIMAGIRIATVTTIGLVTITALIGQEGWASCSSTASSATSPPPSSSGSCSRPCSPSPPTWPWSACSTGSPPGPGAGVAAGERRQRGHRLAHRPGQLERAGRDPGPHPPAHLVLAAGHRHRRRHRPARRRLHRAHGPGATFAVNLTNLGRAIPTLGIIILVFIVAGFGFIPVLVSLFALAVPPIVTNSYIGVRSVDADVREAAEGMGMRGRQVLWQVELPMAMPLIMAGVRTSAVQVVATATLAAYVGLGGLGRYVIDGFSQRDLAEVVGGAILVAVLSLLTELVLGRVQTLVVSKGLAEQGADAAVRAKVEKAA